MFIKELTDQGRLQYDHPLGLCLVAAGRGTTIPLKETLDQPDVTWLQFRRRLDLLCLDLALWVNGWLGATYATSMVAAGV